MGGVFDIMHDVDSCLYGSIGQAITDAGWTDIWTTQTMAKNNLWLNDMNGSAAAFNDPLLQNNAGDVAKWIGEYCNGPDLSIDNWSSAAVLKLQALVSGWYNKDDWGAVLGSVGSFASMVNSATTQDTTTGETEGKNMASQLQTDNTSLQPISDFGSSYSQVLSALANVLSQVGPGA